jgi:hypothetical protein
MKQKTMKLSPRRQEETKSDAERDRLDQFARNEGRYSLEEAAGLLAQHTGELLSTMQDMLERAAFERKLPVYKPGSIVRYEYPDAHGSNVCGFVGHGLEAKHAELSGILDTRWSEEAYGKDLNTWLKDNEPHITLRFHKKPKTMRGIKLSRSDWIEKTHKIADKIALKKYRSGMREISARGIYKEVADELGKDSTTHGNRGPRGAESVRTIGLKGWKFSPPSSET